jgi:hypothetical protein
MRRADDHLRDLGERVRKRNRDQINAFGLRANPARPQSIDLDAGPGVALPVDPIFGILVGEICYNLRAALDYLVYELAILDSGSSKRTQFPIEKSPSGFSSRTREGGFLEGVSPAHVADLGLVQPFNGCLWTQNLQKISNPDKHRTLRGITGQHDVKVDVDSDRTKLEGGPGIIRSATSADGTELFLRFQIATDLFLDDGSPAMTQLNEIRAEVENTLTRFKVDFP